MEKTNSNIKRKIIISVLSILLCALIISVSVYAALSQSLNLTNQITISASGQTQVKVDVYEYSNNAETAITDIGSLATEPSWGAVLVTKGETENSKTQALTPAEFAQSIGINYYAWKITFTNSNVTDNTVYAHITAPAVDNDQIKVWIGTEWASLTANENTAVDADVSLTKGATASYYIVVATDTPLDQLTPSEGSLPFNIDILIDQNA